jgi:CTP:molybdopterin cytidylyltransferase MocA
MRHAGIVLAAGASSRMGQPKALLETAGGRPLARAQYEMLLRAGCERAVIVLGSDAERIRPLLPGCEVTVNARWGDGRMTSVQAGLQALSGFDGYVLLPVDTVGVRSETLSLLLRYAGEQAPPAARLTHKGRRGRLAWVSESAARALVLPAAPAARLDELLRKIEHRVAAPDAGILSNVNTPEDWSKARASMDEPLR